MDERYQTAVDAIQKKFNAGVQVFRDEITLFISPEHIVEAAKTLRDAHLFKMLVDLTAVDYWPQEKPRFHIVYQLANLEKNIILCLRVPLDGHAPHIPTLEGVFPNANWFEREVWDLFGVRFDNHSDLRRILMPYDWEGHPLRKDYPLGYEEVQFTFNFDEIDVKKPYAKE